MSTMFERYGGFAVVSRIVSAFYDKILDSPITSPYFENTDMKTQIDHQTKFISSLMGGPASYTNDMLERVHRPLKVTQEAFDEVAFLLKETFEDFDVEEVDINSIMNEIHNRARFVISA
jgi:hemoglobin